ncbi:protein kinase domain-containing protein [Xylanimonas protaetiae]|uniref:non-specific serine/threonine protein kinase n=1 Tax=Xylanimonas protaetiae TaxID=2509457 RepID=A0A4P6FLD2_9MICO|nr:protein kinase [Xylanimonas protaetiae]QAY71438.1 hypothetical protein ET471_16535 [Xylanimonas protaetiae]
MTTRDEAGSLAPTQGDALGAAPTQADGLRAAVPTRGDDLGRAAPTQGDDADGAALTRADGLEGAVPLLGGIPPAVLEGFEPVRALPSGAQAHLVVCRERASGREVVVKYYVGGHATQYAALRAVYDELRADRSRRLVVPALHWDGRHLWEVQEYFPEGTLQQLVGPQGVARDRARAVLVELVGALHDAHASRVVHRDVKPDNVFVRSRSPLTLVLGDLGAAALLSLDTEVRSSVGSWYYIAPEMYAGEVDVAGKADYWSLGIIVHELLTGRHVLSDEQGRRLGDRLVRHAVLNHNVPVEHPDPRWRLLLEGLLTYDPDHRWAEPEVRDWLAGGSPTVNRLGSLTAPPGPGASLADLPFTLADTVHRDAASLAATLRRSWRPAAEELVDPRKREELTRWLDRAGVDPKILATPYDDPAVLPLALQVLLAPATTPEYRGRGLTEESLTAVAREAMGGSPEAAAWVRELRTGEALTVWAAALAEPDQVLKAQNRLATWWSAAESQARPLVQRDRLVADRAEGDALVASLSDAHRADRLRAGAQALSLEPLPAGEQALRAAAVPLVEAGNAVAAILADLLLRPAHADETTRRAAEAAAERVAARERARQAHAAERAPRVLAARQSLKRHVAALVAYAALLVLYRLTWAGGGLPVGLRPVLTAVGVLALGYAAVYVWDTSTAPRLFAHGTLLFLALVVSTYGVLGDLAARHVDGLRLPVLVIGAMALSRLLGLLFAVPRRGQPADSRGGDAAARTARLVLRWGLVAFVPSALLGATWVTTAFADRVPFLQQLLLGDTPDPLSAATWAQGVLPHASSGWIAQHAQGIWLALPLVAIAWITVWNGIGRARRRGVATGAAAATVAAAALSVWLALPLAVHPVLVTAAGMCAVPLAVAVTWVARVKGDGA